MCRSSTRYRSDEWRGKAPRYGRNPLPPCAGDAIYRRFQGSDTRHGWTNDARHAIVDLVPRRAGRHRRLSATAIIARRATSRCGAAAGAPAARSAGSSIEGEPEGSKVPAGMARLAASHGRRAAARDRVRYPWEKEHQPNMTGTPLRLSSAGLGPARWAATRARPEITSRGHRNRRLEGRG